jgi:hypothetical protein
MTLAVGVCFLLGWMQLNRDESAVPGFNVESYLDRYYFHAKGADSFEDISTDEKLHMLRSDFPIISKTIDWPAHNIILEQAEVYVGRFKSNSRLCHSPSLVAFITARGYLGFAVNLVVAGDDVFVLPGAANPFIL